MRPSLLEHTPVVILAGGLGTRLKSVVSDRPKALAPIGARSFLEIQLEILRDQGARRFVLCVGHRADQVQTEFGDGAHLGIHIDYSIEKELLGTGGALRLAERFFQPRALVLNGDTYLDADYDRLLRHHQTQFGALATLTLARLEDARRFGTVLVDSKEQNVIGFREKIETGPTQGWLNAGAYVIERDLLNRIPVDRPVSLEREVFPAAIAEGLRIAALPCEQPFYDIGTPEDFRRFNAWYGERCHERHSTHSGRLAG